MLIELNSKKGDRIVEKIELLPESRYSEEKNGLVNTPPLIRDWKGLLRQSLSSMSPELKY